MIEIIKVGRKGIRAVEVVLAADCKVLHFGLIRGVVEITSREKGSFPKGELREAYARAAAILKPSPKKK